MGESDALSAYDNVVHSAQRETINLAPRPPDPGAQISGARLSGLGEVLGCKVLRSLELLPVLAGARGDVAVGFWISAGEAVQYSIG